MDRRGAFAAGLALGMLACQSRDERAASSPPPPPPPTDTNATPLAAALPNRGEGNEFVGDRLKASMAWVVAPHRLLTERQLATARTLGSRGVETWTYKATIAADSAKVLRRQRHVACDSDGPLYEYSGEGPSLEYPERVLLIDSSGAEIRAGLVNVHADSSWLADALANVMGNRCGIAHRDTAFSASAGDEFYSFHAMYDSSAAADEENGTHGVKYLVSRGLFLHTSNGAAIASEVTRVEPVECDGCGTPTITDGFGTVYSVTQVLRLPGFPHPVLLLNTSTVEGRALSLETFDDTGAHRSYRWYEYVVNCF